MRKFLIKCLLFSLPLLVGLVLLITIDPYGRFNNPIHSKKLLEAKAKISYSENQPLFKIIDYKKNPADLIILGDSRGNSLKSKKFQELTGLSSYNLSIAGGSLAEASDLFWYATSIHPIQQVYFAINFNLYSETNSSNRVSEAMRLANKPISLLISKYSIKASAKIMQSLLFGKEHSDAPRLSKEEFWEYQLQSSATGFYKHYVYPEQYYQTLVEISEFCRNNKIELVFVIPPTHIDLQKRIGDFDLDDENEKFLSDLRSLGTVYNFDIESPLTTDRDNFSDPFHFISSVADIVVEEVVQQTSRYSAKYP